MSITIDEKKNGDVCILTACGFIDTSTASAMEEKIKKVYTEGKYKVVVNLGGVEFISSAGWGIFVAYLRKLREKGGDIRLSSMIEKVEKIFTLMEFDSLIDSYPDENAAVKSFS